VHIKSQKHENDIHLLLQVHDELVYEVKDSFVNQVVKQFKELMETVFSENNILDVPIVVQAEVGKNWGEMKRI
jgi:DNA polymerase-1